MGRIDLAWRFATDEHVLKKGQLYRQIVPYTHHLLDVFNVLDQFGYRADEMVTAEDLAVASILHDIVEDTDVKLRDIEEMFGPEVAALVDAVTQVDGPNRKARIALTYPKTRAGGRHAVRLKLADRIANVRIGGKMTEMYRKEHEDFRRALYTPGENEDMWEIVDSLLDWGR